MNMRISKGCAPTVILFALLWCVNAVAGVWHHNVYCEEGEREDSQIYHVGDGWHYHFNRGDEQNSYYLCVLHKTLGCRGRALVHLDEGFRHTQPHEGHEADPLYPQELALRRNILVRCWSLECTPFSTILRQERQRFHRLVAARITMASMRTAMRNARISNYPPIPETLRGLTDILADPRFRVLTMTSDREDNVYAGSVTDAAGDHHIVLASRRLLALMSRMTVLFSDGTFQVVPSVHSLRNRRAQVFNIMTSWRHHTIPLAWIIMESRTQDAYEAVFTVLRNLLQRWNFWRVISDDEPAQCNAWNAIFQPDRMQNCLWHISRAFVTHITVLRLGAWFHEPNVPQFRLIVRMACALPLLPAALLRLGWRILCREAAHQGGHTLSSKLDGPLF